MSDFYIENGELKHYGVLGMKWGVRKGRTAQAYEKATKKLKKLTAKVEKAENKARMRSRIADNKRYSAFSTEKGRAKADAKARAASFKASKRINKAKKWIDTMDKVFKNTDVSVSQEYIDLGKSYTEKLNMRAVVREFR